MSYPINYPTPQGANVQIFRCGGNDQRWRNDWVKPQGASFVWFTLIGAGGGGGGSSGDGGGVVFAYNGGGGASGNVTNFMCPAFLIPDVLQVAVGGGGDGGAAGDGFTVGTDGTVGENTFVYYQQKNTSAYEILKATGGGGGSGAPFANGSGGNALGADIGSPMTVAGFFYSTNGQGGANGGTSISASTTTFLMGGNGRYDTNQITGAYGYKATTANGYSQLSPIPVCIAGGNNLSNTTTKQQNTTPFGCGGTGGGDSTANSAGGRGGDGLAIIVTW